ncbi:MAG: protein O-mannosyl-transferase family [Vulcanimicrobiaceae bacterium]
MIARTPLERRSDLLVATMVGIVALSGYVATLPRSVSFWDTGELQTVPYILGIAHPTASPSFVLLGWLFTHALPFGAVATRVDAMCSVVVACSAALLFATLRGLAAPRVLALVCALGFAFAPIPWQDATRAEVQDVALLFRVLALFFGLRWAAGGNERDLFALALFAGLAFATHGLALLVLPALALFVPARRDALRPRSYALLAGGFVVGLLPFAYLPLRSAVVTAAGLDPTHVLGLPLGMAFWDYDHPSTLRGFFRLVTGADFDTHSGFAGFWNVAAYPQFVQAAARRVGENYGWLGAFATALGTLVIVVSRRLELWALLVAGLLPIPYTESYGELTDPDRYYLLPLWCAATAIALGAAALVQWLSDESAWRWIAAAVLGASFLWGTSSRAEIFVQRYDPGASAYVAEIERVTPPGAILVAEWSFATPLAYAAYVEHALDDRTVVSAAPDQFEPYYPAWLAHRPLFLVTFSATPDLPGYRLRRVSELFNIFRVEADAQTR